MSALVNVHLLKLLVSVCMLLFPVLQVMGSIPGLANLIPQANDKASQVRTYGRDRASGVGV